MHRITIQYATPGDPDGFDAYYRDSHVPLASTLPGLRRFSLSRPRALGAGEVPYLVAELWFDDADALKAALRSPEMAATAADAEKMVAAHAVPGTTMFTGEVTDTVTDAPA